MDRNEYAKRVFGYKVGQFVSDADAIQIEKELEYYRKEKAKALIKQEFEPGAQPAQPPQFMSLTNSEGRVIDVLVKPDGTPQVVEPKTQNTQQGIMTMVNPTNAVPVVNPQTGQPIMGYAADPSMGGAPAPTAGGGMFGASNAATPTATPTPSPTPYPEGATIRGKRDGLLYKVVNGVPQLIPGQ